MSFTKMKLSDLCTEISYGYTTSAIEKNTGFKFLRITDIQGGKVEWDTVPFCEIESKNIQKYKLIDGDIVIARTGNSTGENYIYQDDNNSIFASYLIRYRINKEIANPYYVWLNLRISNWWGFVSGAKSGSAQAGANAKVLGTFELPIPNLETQNKIADFFQYINKKIQLNTQINQTLEQIAQAIFKSWFVDFDPVRAKAAALESGKTHAEVELAAMQAISGKSAEELAQMPSESYAELAEIAKAFPSGFGEDGVPMGWEVKPLGNLISFVKGKKPKETFSKQEENMLPHILTSSLEGRYNEYCEANKLVTVDYQNTIMLMDGSNSGRIAIGHNGVIGSTLAKIELKDNKLWSIIYHLLKHQEKDIQANTTGTTIPHTDKNRVNNYDLVIPSDLLLDKFNTIFDNSLLQVISNRKQIINLEKIRDLLLPRLLNGELNE